MSSSVAVAHRFRRKKLTGLYSQQPSAESTATYIPLILSKCMLPYQQGEPIMLQTNRRRYAYLVNSPVHEIRVNLTEWQAQRLQEKLALLPFKVIYQEEQR